MLYRLPESERVCSGICMNQTNLFAGLIPRLSDLRQRGLLKWDDEEEDDVEKEEEEIQVRKHRNRPR